MTGITTAVYRHTQGSTDCRALEVELAGQPGPPKKSLLANFACFNVVHFIDAIVHTIKHLNDVT